MNESIPKLRFSEFQDEWNKSLLQESLDYVKSGKSTKSNEGLLPLYGSTGIIGNTNDSIQEGAYILIARVGANAGQINLVQGKFGVSDNTLILSLKDKMNIYFLKEFLTQYNLNKLVYGTGQPLVTGGLLKKIKINIPSLPEQQKIASFLTDVDNKITKLTKKKDLLEQYKKGIMQKIFSQELRFKDENGNEFPKWEVKKLGDIANVTIGEFVIKTKQNPNAKYPVFNGGKSWTGFYDEYNNEGNKIIISARGANAGFVNYEKRKFWAGNSCYSVDIIDKKINNVLYMFYFIKFKQNLFTDYQQAANIPSVSKKDVQVFKISSPSIQEQTKIANFLSDIDVKIEALNAKIENSKAFKKGLLQQMFV